MVVGSAKLTLKASWVRSLKEKRMIVKSIIGKTRNTFNVSMNEVEEMDTHQTIVIGLSCTSNSNATVNSTLDQILNYIESNFETELRDVETDIFTF
ncbi:MAG TPA: DUF503 domain-containing protein [Firmicutes bacterium]|nr:DUF503 domain-containing protein [Bacillota bacterium]